MYSINKYKLLRHTDSNSHGSGCQRPCSLNWVDLNFHQEQSVWSHVVSLPGAATLLLISVLVGQRLGVIMYTLFSAGLEAGCIYTAHRHRCSPNVTS